MQQKYGVNVLKERGCNSRLKPLTDIAALTACIICGQDSASRVMAHKMSTEAWKEVALTNPAAAGEKPMFQTMFDKAASSVADIVQSVRGKK